MKGNWIFWVCYWLVRFYLKIFRGFKVYGIENIPLTGPVIVAGNHVSNFDPPVLGVAMPRYSRFLAKKELFKKKFFNWFLHQLGAFPIDRGKADLEALKTSIKILKDGGLLIIFPEGTRRKPGDLGKAQGGVISIALRGHAPIIPCALTNTAKGRPVTVRIGQPISLEKYYDQKLSKEETEELGEKIMGEIQKLLDVDQFVQK